MKHIIKKSKGKLFFLAIFIFVLQLVIIKNRNMITIFDDEWGYISTAAYIAGYDWSAITSSSHFYSSGYSILIYPFFKLFSNPYFIYKCILIFNALIMSSTVFIIYDVVKKILPSFSENAHFFSTFVVAVYPSYLIYSSFAMAEVLLTGIQWVLIWLIIRLKDSTLYIILLSFVAGYSIIIHQRMIGILIALTIIIIIMRYIKKISIKNFIVYFLSIILMLFFYQIIKNFFINNLWLGSEIAEFNNISGTSERIMKLLTLSGLKDTLKILLGNIYYSGISTFLLSILGFICLIGKNINILKKFVANSTDLSTIDIAYLYILLSISGTALITAIFLNEPNSIKHVLYGRYNEITVVPTLIFAVMFLCNNNKKIYYKIVAVIASIFTFYICSIVAIKYINYLAIDNTNFFSVGSIAAFTGVNLYYNIVDLSINLQKATSCSIFALIIISFLSILKNKIINRQLLITVIIASLFVGSSMKFSREFNFLREKDNIIAKKMQSIRDHIYENNELSNTNNIYAGLRNTGNGFKYYLQFIFFERNINTINVDDSSNLEVGDILCTFKDIDIPSDQFELLIEVDNYFVWKKVI